MSDDHSAVSRLVAVVGAGPSGIFAAAEPVKRPDVQVDVFDRLPTPFGLVRHGVAPDLGRPVLG